MRAFDLLGPLPVGTTVLEASAGTGKTYTIAGLVTRYVAEGVARLDELLVVTFGRGAAQELRDRVRERLVRTRDALAGEAASDDPLVAHLVAVGREPAHRRLVDALAAFDAATVATTHGFCEQVLRALGTAADTDDAAELVENLDDLTVEVVQDLYVRKWAHPDADAPPLTIDQAIELAKVVVGDGQATLVPASPQPGSVADVRRRLADAVRAGVGARKRAHRVLGFDDLLTRLRDTLRDPGQQAAAHRLRSRYRIVLVDEFQDTDPVQWDVLRLAFHGHATLVLIGDPKQAIYAFRGADVHAYLAALDAADDTATLAQNWRSDPDLLRGLEAVFRGARLGDERIDVKPVRAGHEGQSLAVPDAAPVRLRTVRAGADLLIGPARDLVLDDLVGEVVDLLESGAVLTPRGAAPRPVEPRDLAVVVRTDAQLDLVHRALLGAGVPAVRRTTSSVFRTAAAQDWIVLLEALEQPHRSARVRRLAITRLVGWSAADLEHRDVDTLALRLRQWLAVFAERGVAALFDAVSRDERLVPRLLAHTDGERALTDLRHVAETLHGAVLTGQLGLAAGAEWLRQRVEEARADRADERSRRLDSDAAAVQVMTVHASKGLEFPVVYVPFGWDRFPFEPQYPLFHDADGLRVRNVGGESDPGFADDCARHVTEELGEDLRLLYVALTRAQAQVTAWWAPSRKNTTASPLHRLLITDEPSAGVPERLPIRPDVLDVLAARAVPGALSVTEVEPRPRPHWNSSRDGTGPLSVAVLDRGLDSAWRRTSYTALTRAAYEAAVGSEPEVTETDDEPDLPAAADTAAAADDDADDGDASGRDVPSPMADLPGGTGFGTLVHAILERYDPGGDLTATVREQTARFAPDLSAETLQAALEPALATPLGELAAGRSLAGIAVGDRLAELDFELPLGGGDAATGTARLTDLAGIWAAHLGPDDPLAGYPALLADPLLGPEVLRGYLGGSIDAVLRVDGRYLVVDYKTNRLGEPDVPLTAWDYRTDAMREAMLHAHYPLQAMLYTVALHRFLRWRLPDYDPAQHLGGVLYLFLRGMCGPDHPGSGVFAWRPAPALVVAISEALA